MLREEFPKDHDTLQKLDMLDEDEIENMTPHGWVAGVKGVVGVSTDAKERLEQSLPV
jgi:hypothetical protein